MAGPAGVKARVGLARVQQVWTSIREPRHIKTVYLTYYLIAIATGLVTYMDPPGIIETTVGAAATAAFSTFLIVGGIMGAVSVYRGWWWLERLGNWSCIWALLIFLIVIITLISQQGIEAGSIYAGVGTLASGIFLVRLLMIHGFTYEPRG